MGYILGIVGVIAAIWLTFTGIHINTGEGEHTGFITAVEKNGLIFKTHTAYIKTDTSSSQEDLYCVIDPAVAQTLKILSSAKEHVTIQYMSYLLPAIDECNGESAIITGVMVEAK